MERINTYQPINNCSGIEEINNKIEIKNEIVDTDDQVDDHNLLTRDNNENKWGYTEKIELVEVKCENLVDNMKKEINEELIIKEEPCNPATDSEGSYLEMEQEHTGNIHVHSPREKEDISIPLSSKVTHENVQLRNTKLKRTNQESLSQRIMFSKLRKVEKTVALLKRRRAILNDKFLSHSANPHDISLYLQNLPKPHKVFLLRILKNFNKSKPLRFKFYRKSLLLYIFKHSPKCYRYLNTFLDLPSPNILRKLSSNFNLKSGINEQVFKYLNSLSASMSKSDRHCIIMFDEMKIAKNLNLIVNKSTCRVEGFVKGDELNQPIADHVLVFMIRGIRRRWQQSVAFYLTNYANQWILKKFICEVIRSIHELTYFKVDTSISDANRRNVAAVRLLTRESGYDINDYIYNVDNHKIFHIFNAPHLLECLKNDFVDKNIIFGGNKTAKWIDIKHVYIEDGTTSTAKTSKLHLETAAQLFSHDTKMYLECLTHHKIINGQHTAEFIGFISNLFDYLYSPASTKAFGCRPTSRNLNFWSAAKETLNELIFLNEHNNKMSTPNSIQFLIRSINNIQLLYKYLNSMGYKFLPTRSLNKDPIEHLFSAVRELCGTNRPTSSQFISAYQTYLLKNAATCNFHPDCENRQRYIFAYDSFRRSRSCVFNISLISPSINSCVTNPSSLVASTSFETAVNISKKINQLSGSSVARILIKELLHHKCQFCTEFLLSDNCSGIHDSIRLKEYSGETCIKYPSELFIQCVNKSKDQIFHMIPLYIHLPNFFYQLTQSSFSIPSIFCTQHGDIFQSQTVNVLCLAMLRQFVKKVNLKISNKDSRPNEVIDSFIRNI